MKTKDDFRKPCCRDCRFVVYPERPWFSQPSLAYAQCLNPEVQATFVSNARKFNDCGPNGSKFVSKDA